MTIIKIIIVSFTSLAAMFLFTKLIGNKQMSQLNMFDYINGITIGSIAAEMATELENNPMYPLVAMAVYAVIIWVISFLSQKSLKLRRFFEGRSLMLMGHGKIYVRNFKTAKLDINEFLTQCRVNGYFNIDDIEEAFIEPNGQISFNPKAKARPVQPSDIGILPQDNKAEFTIIIDGHVLNENLKQSGNNYKWLENELHRLGIGSVNDVFLGVCENKNKLRAFKKTNDNPINDMFQ